MIFGQLPFGADQFSDSQIVNQVFVTLLQKTLTTRFVAQVVPLNIKEITLSPYLLPTFSALISFSWPPTTFSCTSLTLLHSFLVGIYPYTSLLSFNSNLTFLFQYLLPFLIRQLPFFHLLPAHLCTGYLNAFHQCSLLWKLKSNSDCLLSNNQNSTTSWGVLIFK